MRFKSKQSRVAFLAMGVVLGACSNNSNQLNVTPAPAPAPTPSVQTTAALSATSTPYLGTLYRANQYKWSAVEDLNGSIYALGYPNSNTKAQLYNVTRSTAGATTAPSNVSADDSSSGCENFIGLDRAGPSNSTGVILAATASNVCVVTSSDTSLVALDITNPTGASFTGVYGGLSGSQFAVRTSREQVLFYTWNTTDADVTAGNTATVSADASVYSAVDGVWVNHVGVVSLIGTDGASYLVGSDEVLAFGVDGQGNGIAQTASNKVAVIQGTLACAKAQFAGVCMVEHTLASGVENVANLAAVLPSTDSNGLYVIAGRDRAVDAINLPGVQDAATAQGGVQASVTGVGTAIFGDAATAATQSGATIFVTGFTTGAFFEFDPSGAVNMVTFSSK